METKKYAVLTDSTCDIPLGMEKEFDVDIMNFKIALDGESYEERVDFTPSQYCDMIRNAKEMPMTSQITAFDFLEKYKAYDDAGVEDLLYVSINGKASSTNANARRAVEEFKEERPQSAMRIFVVDSHCYSFVYGGHVIEAAKRLKAGETMESVVAYLEDVFTRMETVLTAYSLKIIRKSGRVSAASAIAGDLLNIRPVFTLNGGESQVIKKVRGDKAVCANICRYVKSRIKPGAPYVIGISNPQYVEEYEKALTETLGYPPALVFELGSAVLSNTGPDAIGVGYECAEPVM